MSFNNACIFFPYNHDYLDRPPGPGGMQMMGPGGPMPMQMGPGGPPMGGPPMGGPQMMMGG